MGEGISPLNEILSLLILGSGSGTADNNARVYGCKGFENNSSVGDSSIIIPKYITPILSEYV